MDKIGNSLTLHKDNDGIFLWISYVNPELYDLNVTDNLTHATYCIAEYDGLKYYIKNQKAFDGYYIKAVRENPSIIGNIRSFIDYHKPITPSLSESFQKLYTNFVALWKKKSS